MDRQALAVRGAQSARRPAGGGVVSEWHLPGHALTMSAMARVDLSVSARGVGPADKGSAAVAADADEAEETAQQKQQSSTCSGGSGGRKCGGGSRGSTCGRLYSSPRRVVGKRKIRIRIQSVDMAI